ncbi:MAG: hypothetical protein WC455_25840 [Dehalococcoidia bacterium]|jgi:hypothetical protein
MAKDCGELRLHKELMTYLSVYPADVRVIMEDMGIWDALDPKGSRKRFDNIVRAARYHLHSIRVQKNMITNKTEISISSEDLANLTTDYFSRRKQG